MKQDITIIVVAILLALFLAVHGTRLIRWLKKRDFKIYCKCLKFKKKSKSENIPVGVTHVNPNTQSPKMRPKLHINGGASTIYAPSAIASTVNTVETPLSRRLPAEDLAVNYTYDNGGLVVTPESERNHGTESNF